MKLNCEHVEKVLGLMTWNNKDVIERMEKIAQEIVKVPSNSEEAVTLRK